MLQVVETQKRTTIYFASDVHRALRLKAASLDRSISDMVNEAVQIVLAEDAEDLASFAQRKAEKGVSFARSSRA
ncbi:MAG: CopG family transcriptional regulator [Deltaproteobacteria bacterium]|nr:CopG family transcriptional regulator [Deltaproteobacteria bacterium]